MKFSVYFKFIFTTFLLILYSDNTNASQANGPSTSKGTAESQNNQTKQSGPQSHQKTEVIELESSFDHTHNVDYKETSKLKKRAYDPTLFTYCSYEINRRNRGKILKALGITQFTFNGKNTFELDDTSRLPNFEHCSHIDVFVCQHGEPVMIGFKTVEDNKNKRSNKEADKRYYNYYYIKDSETGSLKNVMIMSSNEQPGTDCDGLVRYVARGDITTEGYCKEVERIWPEVSENACGFHKPTSEALGKPSFEISIIPSGESKGNFLVRAYRKCAKCLCCSSSYNTDDVENSIETIKCKASLVHAYKMEEIPLFKYCLYEINSHNQNKITDSIEVPQFTCNGKVVEFEDSSHLPSHTCWRSFAIFLCEHGQLVIFRIKASGGDKNHRYYYVLDPETKKFKNTAVTFVDEEEEKDEDGLVRYTEPVLVKVQAFCQKVEQKWAGIYSDLCQGYQDAVKILKTPLLGLVIVPSGKSTEK